MRELHHAPRPVVQHQQTWRLHTRTAQRVCTGEWRCRLVCARLAFDIVALHGSQTQHIYHTEREKRDTLSRHTVHGQALTRHAVASPCTSLCPPVVYGNRYAINKLRAREVDSSACGTHTTTHITQTPGPQCHWSRSACALSPALALPQSGHQLLSLIHI